jgi:F-type H+-transporting ATPase subunit delta
MKALKIKHYAKALVEIAGESNSWEQLLADLSDVAEKLNAELEFKQFLVDKHITLAKKKEFLEKVFKDFIGKQTYNFLFLLIRDDKLVYLDSILEIAKDLNYSDAGVKQVLVESVVALSPKQARALEKILQEKLEKDLVLKNVINPDLLGGLKLTIGDTEIDSSIRGKIDRLKQKIQSLDNIN